MFEAPKVDQFTQGTIFSCAHAERYKNLPIYGLVITARCDAAQKKVPIYSYIPVVSLIDWIFSDGCEIIVGRHILDHTNTLDNILNDLELSSSLMRTKTREEIIETSLKPLLSQDKPDKRLQGKVQKFIATSEAIQKAEQALQNASREFIKPILKDTPKIFDQVLKELAGNRLMGYYFLRSMPTLNGEAGDYIALLREVHHIPNSAAMRITNGLSKNEWEEDPIQGARCPIFTEVENYCAPVARLTSPWMEHLMQSWGLLFTRIGVEDIDVSSVKKSLSGLGLDNP